MKKFLLVSFILCSFYGFSAKVSTQRSNTLKSENKAGKNIGEMTIKETIEKLSENDRIKIGRDGKDNLQLAEQLMGFKI